MKKRIAIIQGHPDSHGFERGILAFAGVAPIRENLIGSVDSCNGECRGRWLIKMQAFARMDEGRYGICRECRNPIESKRIEAVPHATRCLRCASTASASDATA